MSITRLINKEKEEVYTWFDSRFRFNFVQIFWYYSNFLVPLNFLLRLEMEGPDSSCLLKGFSEKFWRKEHSCFRSWRWHSTI